MDFSRFFFVVKHGMLRSNRIYKDAASKVNQNIKSIRQRIESNPFAGGAIHERFMRFFSHTKQVGFYLMALSGV
jgi:hypothetical protein